MRYPAPAARAAAYSITIDRLFSLDNVTHMASVELLVLLTTLLLVIRFVCDFKGPWYANRRMMPIILIMETLNHSLVIYTLGLMQLSGEKVNDYFQAWAVLLVTLQYSVKIGRPYTRSKQIPLLDLMSSFWSAHLLRVQTFFLLRLPLWLIWSLNAFRIILFFVSDGKADTINQESMRLVSDYMKSEDALCGDDDQKKSAVTFAGDDKKEFDMRGYKYLVHGEQHLVLKEVQEAPQEVASSFKKRTREEHGKQNKSEELDRDYKIQLHPDEGHKEKLVTVEKIWNDAGQSGLLGRTADRDNQRKDMCLSFALYKLLRRRFYNLPMHELARQQGKEKISSLVFDYILGKDCERAFRITEVELSFLQDLFYSKHATMFAGGFLIPVMSLLLSLLLAVSTGYIAYPVGYIPERMDRADRNRILHGVFITRLMVAIIVIKELGEIYLYVFSRWAKVLMLCKYVQHRCLRNPVVEMVMRWMLDFSSKVRWNQKIGQHNLLVLSRVWRLGFFWFWIKPCQGWTFRLYIILPLRMVYCRGQLPGKIHLEDYTKNAILDSLKSLRKDPRKLGEYFRNTVGQKMAWPSDELKVDTHIILVWHIATCLCEIEFFDDKVKALKAVDPLGRVRSRPLVGEPKAPAARDDHLPHFWGVFHHPPSPLIMTDGVQGRQAKSESSWCKQYAVAVSLSNYCAYLVTRALVPDNGLVAKKVFGEVIREIDHVTSDKGMRRQLPKEKVGSMEDVYKRFMATANLRSKDKYPDQGRGPDEEMPEGGDQEEPKQDDDDDDLDIENSLTKMGAELGKQLTVVYDGDAAGLWRDLAEFWTGFLLHLAASTRAAKHRTHLGGSGEFITHLWALLSHAGFDGPAHGEQLLDAEDLEDANPFME